MVCGLLVGTQLNTIIQDVLYNILVVPRVDTAGDSWHSSKIIRADEKNARFI